MQRFTIIVFCLCLLLASAVSALARCDSLGEGTSIRGGIKALVVAQEPGAGHESHHSHGGNSQIHCADMFTEFVISARASLNPPGRSAKHLSGMIAPTRLALVVCATGSSGFDTAPPVFPALGSRYLFLSVFRI